MKKLIYPKIESTKILTHANVEKPWKINLNPVLSTTFSEEIEKVIWKETQVKLLVVRV